MPPRLKSVLARIRGRRVATIVLGGAVLGSSLSGSSVLASAPPSSPPADSAAAVDLESIEGLVGGLLDADVLGVPGDWAIRDADASVVADGDQAALADLDPFLGLLACPEGTIREGSDRVWVSRRYSAPEVPLENGLLSVEIFVEVESASDAQVDRDALADCSVSEYARLSLGETELASAEQDPLDGVTVELLASASETVPYPSAFDAVIVNADGCTVTVVLGGIDMGESWAELADDITQSAIDHLSCDHQSTTTSTT